MTRLGRLRVVRSRFSGVTREYARLLWLFSLAHAAIWRRNIIRCAAAPGGAWVVDIACGPGVLTFDWARAGARVVGVDLAPEMLDEARRQAARRGVDVDWVRAVAERLPFRDGASAASAVSLATRNFADVGAAFAEMCRVVQGGGAVIAFDFAWPPPGLFASLYAFYLEDVLPSLGRLVSVDWHELLAYLAATVRRAMPPARVAHELHQTGAHIVRCYRMTGGTVALVEGRR